VEHLEDRAVPATITVNSALDSNARDGVLTLREAILLNNDPNVYSTWTSAERLQVSGTVALGSLDTIAFNIPVVGVPRISVTGALDTITDRVLIDGTTQQSWAKTPFIELNGASAPAGTNGLAITAGNSTIRGMVINGFGGSGIFLGTNDGNTLTGNRIGTTADGTAALGNRYGVYIESEKNRVAGNLISGNGDGVRIVGSGATGNRVEGNRIGTNAAGTAALGNSGAGVYIESANNVVGGTATGAGNLISGNATGTGVSIVGTGSTGNRVEGNLIGIDASGTAVLGNNAGVVINASNNVVGGAAAGAGNVISGNASVGVWIPGTGNRVEGNRIGTDATGTVMLANGIGVHLTSSSNVVGGTAAGTGNTISGNTNSGVRIIGSGATGNTIRGNAIYANGGRGIDLGGDGVTANDVGDVDVGPNNYQNFPTLPYARAGTSTRVAGSLNSTPNATFVLDFYANTAADPSGYGEGERYLGSTTVTTDAAGNSSFDVTLGAAADGEWITATATGPDGSTSEFSLARKAVANRAPTGIALSNASVAENAPAGTAVGTLSATDPDAGDTFTYALVSGDGDGDNGLFNISGDQLRANGSFDYEARSDYSVRVRATDAGGSSVEALVAITVTNVNEAPVEAYSIWVSSPEDDPYGFSIDLRSGASDPEGDALSVTGLTLVSGDPRGVAVSADGTTLSVTPTAYNHLKAGQTEDIRYAYIVSDGNGGTLARTGHFAIVGANDAPVAVNDTLSVTEDAGPVSGNLLANDVDPDGDALSVVAAYVQTISSPYGILTIQADGTYTYTVKNAAPAVQALKQGQQVTDTFVGVYRATDGTATSNLGTLTVTITGMNDAPVQAYPISYGLPEDDPYGVTVGLLDGVTDAEGDTLTVTGLTLVSGDARGVTVGTGGTTLTVIPTAYNHLKPGQNEEIVYSFTATDGNGGSLARTATFTIIGANDAPVAVNDAAVVSEDGPAVTGNLLANDLDPDGDALSVPAGYVQTISSPYGTMVVAADGSYTYTPKNVPAVQGLRAGQQLADTFVGVYRATDGTATSATGTLTVTITGVNDAPVLGGVNNFPPITEDEVFNGGILVADLIAGGVTDPDTAALKGVAVVGLDNGNGAWRFTTEDWASWSYIGAFSPGQGFLLRPQDRLAFVPNGNTGTAASVTLRAWDQTSGSFGSFVNIPAPGGTSAFSAATVTATISVASLPDTRTWDGGGGADTRWTTAANWVGDFAPEPGDHLVFNVAPGTTTNDFPAGTTFGSITYEFVDVVLPPGTVLDGGSGPLVISGNVSSEDTIEMQGKVIIEPDGSLVALKMVVPEDATLTVNGEVKVKHMAVEKKAMVKGDSTITSEALTFKKEAILSPGNSPGALTIQGALTLEAGSIYLAELAGTTPGEGGHDQIRLEGVIDLTGATLSVNLLAGFVPALGDSFTIIDNDGADTVVGTFDGLPEGTPLALPAGPPVFITYRGGDGNDVALVAGEPPTAIALSAAAVAENQPARTVVGTLSATDADQADGHTFALVAGDGSADNDQFEIVGSQLLTRAPFDYEAGSAYTVRVRATDATGLSFEEVLAVAVADVNEAPVAGPVAAPTEPQAAGASIAVSATFTDPDTADPATGYAATWHWGDGSSSAGTVTGSAGSFSAGGNHTYTAAGVYTVRLVVADGRGGTAVSYSGYVVVYDASAGFVTGGGWIDSPAGAYVGDPTLSGKATFGFVSQYKNGATVPTGNTRFEFKAGDFEFKSTSYDWLVVAGDKAKFKGTGSVNGVGGYSFMLTAVDGKNGDPDKFRIKIWNADGLVYDNQMGESDDSYSSTALGGGSIVIHK
jgi:VCBS repeat-containing protein